MSARYLLIALVLAACGESSVPREPPPSRLVELDVSGIVGCYIVSLGEWTPPLSDAATVDLPTSVRLSPKASGRKRSIGAGAMSEEFVVESMSRDSGCSGWWYQLSPTEIAASCENGSRGVMLTLRRYRGSEGFIGVAKTFSDTREETSSASAVMAKAACGPN